MPLVFALFLVFCFVCTAQSQSSSEKYDEYLAKYIEPRVGSRVIDTIRRAGLSASGSSANGKHLSLLAILGPTLTLGGPNLHLASDSFPKSAIHPASRVGTLVPTLAKLVHSRFKGWSFQNRTDMPPVIEWSVWCA